MQVAITGERRFVVATDSALYGVNGEQIERRASNGPWPNLMAVNESILLSGDKMACARGDGGAPLRRSVDGGRTWQAAQASGVQGGLMARPVPTLGDDLFAAACDGLFRSTDSGATWQRLAILEPDHEVVDLATTPDGATLYMVALFGEGGTTRVLASEREGQTWSQARSLRESWGGGVITVGVEQGRETIYFGSPLGVWISREAGARWQALNQGLESTILLADPRAGALPAAEQAKLQRAVGIYSLAADLDQPRVLLGGSDGVYLLQPEGTWRKLPALENQLVREVFTDLQGQVYARTDTGVHRLRGI